MAALVVAFPDIAAADTSTDGGYALVLSSGEVGPAAMLDVTVTDPAGGTTATVVTIRSGAVAEAPSVVPALAGPYVAVVTARGGEYATATVEFTVTAGEVATIPVRLVATRGDVTGRILQPSGRPAAYVVYSVTSSSGVTVRRWVTAADGSYRVDDLEPGRFVIDTGSDSTAVEVVADTVTTAPDLVALAPVDVFGRVTVPTGVPEADLVVTLRPTTGSTSGSAGSSLVVGGAFRMQRVPQGTYLLEVTDQARDDRVVPERRVVTLGEDPVDVGTLVLSDGAPITGIARDALGRPVEDQIRSVQVSCSTGAVVDEAHWASSTTGADGLFRLPALPGACYSLQQMSAFRAFEPIAPDRVRSGTGGLVLHPAYAIHLTVVGGSRRYGSATFRVKVDTPVPTSVAVPTGTLLLWADERETPIARARIVGGYATFPLGTKLKPGTHALTASLPWGEFAGADAGASVEIAKASASVTVRATGVHYGKRATVTVTFVAKVPVTGKVVVEHCGRRVGSGVIRKHGAKYVAVIHTSRLGSRHHRLLVRYAGSPTVHERVVTTAYRT
jgi:hypothetical protein